MTQIKKNTYVIGDIHGDIKTLKALLSFIAPKDGDKIIFLGDYIDRGPNSKAVIDLLIDLSKSYECDFIRGNHEEFLLKSLEGETIVENIWLRHGGTDTLKSYGVETVEELAEVMPKAHLEFYKNTKHYVETDGHIFTHANWQKGVPAEDQTISYLRYLFMSHAQPDRKLKKTVIVGHSALKGGKPAKKGNLLCIDTLEHGWLTAYNLGDFKFYQAGIDGGLRVIKRPEKFTIKKHVPRQFWPKKR